MNFTINQQPIPSNDNIQDARREFKANVEAEGLDFGTLSAEWCRDFDFPDGFVYAEDGACYCMVGHHYHSAKDGKLLQVG